MGLEIFHGRRLVIATMHHKERVIAPLVNEALKTNCFVNEELDTNQFGTFSGEVERVHSAIDAARLKCEEAMKISGADLAIASEGSFGAHPYIFFSSANEEIVLLIDKKNNLEVVGKVLETKTNYKNQWCSSIEQVEAFAEEVMFPSHGIILKDKQLLYEELHKGISDRESLIQLASSCLKKYGKVWLETDMRAMHNPTRMKTIEAATQKLLKEVMSLCPVCSFPGYSITKIEPGLPCEQCNMPTRAAQAHIYTCKKCHHVDRILFPNRKEFENPMFCDFCNP